MLLRTYIDEIKALLIEFLGPPRNDYDTEWIQFCCPCCADEKDVESDGKYKLEVSITLGAYHCWVCGDSNGTKGRLSKLIRDYGSHEHLRRYYDILEEVRRSQEYSLDGFTVASSDLNTLQDYTAQIITFPKEYKPLTKTDPYAREAYNYLYNRGLTDQIITDFQIGYIGWHPDFKMAQRIIVPSYDMNDDLNYWIARDYSHRDSKYRYNNPKVPKTRFVFNEGRINWYDNITLVEGVFDHIVVPNSIPLLGKTLNPGDAVFEALQKRAMANVNVMLDADAQNDAKRIYKTLEESHLRGRIRLIPMCAQKDASDIFRDEGFRGIVKLLRTAEQLDEFDLIEWAF